jgi:hypothetical protein
VTVQEPHWEEILDEVEERYRPGIVRLRVEDREIRFENRHDESAFRLSRMRATAEGEFWRLEERVDDQVVRIGVGDDWRTALDRYDHAVRTGETVLGPDRRSWCWRGGASPCLVMRREATPR